MLFQKWLGASSRLGRQPTTMVLVLGSLATVLLGGFFNSFAEPSPAPASAHGADPAIARLEAYVATKLNRFPQSHAPPSYAQDAPALPDVATMAARLEARLAKEPDDAEGWRLLGLSRAHLGNGAGAAEAYARALELRPGDAELAAALEETHREAAALAR